MLELDDIQHFLLTRPAAQVAHYAFVSFSHPEESRSWLAGLIDKVGSGAIPQARQVVDARWVTIAFTWNGLRALGVDEASLSTFPEEFRQGMAARAAVLGDSGANHPDRWIDGLQREDLHAILILFASDLAERQRCIDEYRAVRVAIPRRETNLDTESGSGTAVRLRARSFWLPRSALAARHRGNRRCPDAGVRFAEAWRVFPGTPMKTAGLGHCRSRRFCHATAAIWPTAGSKSTWVRSGIFFASMGTHQKSRSLSRRS